MIRKIVHEWITGIDIGGSHITVGMVDMQTKSVMESSIQRMHIDCNASAQEIISDWCKVIQDVWGKIGIKSPIGFAMPGPFDYQNGICLMKGSSKYDSLYGMDIRKSLTESLQINGDDISFKNDAEAFLEGELFCGAAQEFQHAIGLTLGTGLGSASSHLGVTVDAELSVLYFEGENIEESISTRGLLRVYKERTGRQLKDGKAIADIYYSDADARAAFEIFSNKLKWFLEYFIKKENPEVVVMGGNIIQCWDLFMPETIHHLSAVLPRLPKIVKANLGETAALIGGACSFERTKEVSKNHQSTIGQNT